MSFVVMALDKRLKRSYVSFLWDKAWRVVSRSVGVIVLFFDYLCGGQGIVSKRFDGAFLQIYFLRFRLRYGVHIFSFHEIKKYSVHPNWDERCLLCIRGATQLRLTKWRFKKIPVMTQREASLTLSSTTKKFML